MNGVVSLTSRSAAAGTSSAKAPTTSRRSTDIDGFRGFAALTVVVFHAWQFCRAGGHTAFEHTPAGLALAALDGMISWFFITSAFLLFRPIVRRVRRGEEPGSPRAFLLRRLLRVLPVYWLAVLLVWSSRNGRLPGDWRDLVEHLTLTQVFDNKRIFYTLGPAWTLAVEVAFYSAVALWLVVLRRAASRLVGSGTARWAAVLAPAAFLVVVSAGYHVALLAGDVPFDNHHFAYWFNVPSFADNFSLGMILAVVAEVRSGRPLTGWSLRALHVLTVGMVGALFALPEHNRPLPFVLFHEVSAAACALVLACTILAPDSSWWRRALSWRPLVRVGTVSFSLYVWHEPLLLFLDRTGILSHSAAAFPIVAAVLLAGGLIVAFVMYQVLELPLLNLLELVGKDGRLVRPGFSASSVEQKPATVATV